MTDIQLSSYSGYEVELKILPLTLRHPSINTCQDNSVGKVWNCKHRKWAVFECCTWQENIPVGCMLPTWKLYVCQFQWLSPVQVCKVSSDHQQVLVPVRSPVLIPSGWGKYPTWPVLGRSNLPRDLSDDHLMLPNPSCEQTDGCENIMTPLRKVHNSKGFHCSWIVNWI